MTFVLWLLERCTDAARSNIIGMTYEMIVFDGISRSVQPCGPLSNARLALSSQVETDISVGPVMYYQNSWVCISFY